MARIVCIHAHPDDAEILAGGTLALLADSGHSLTIVSMTPGDCGSATQDGETIAAIRRAEAAGAARLINANYVCAEFRDLAIFNDDASRRRVTELLRELQPEIVLTASPEDYHCDHEATSILVRDGCFAAPAPNYLSGRAPVLGKIPHLYFLDPIDADVKPDFFVNVESTFMRKREMLSRHASQREWLLKQHGLDDYLDTMEVWTKRRGSAAGLKYAEGFRQFRGHPYPREPLLQMLLGSRQHHVP